MWFWPTKREFRKELDKIRNAFWVRDNQILTIQKEFALLREQLREPTTRSSIEKRIKKRIDDVKLMKAISSCIKEGYTTNHIRDDIIARFGIKTTCFFKYLKLVREQLRVVTTRRK